MDRFRWAERRDGLITSDVLRAAGRTKKRRELDRASRRHRVVRRGVVAVNGSPRSRRQAVRAVLLAAGDLVAGSHVTALRMLGGDAGPTEAIHVIAPPNLQVTMSSVVDDLLRRKLLDLEQLRRRVSVLRSAPGRSVKTLRTVLGARIPGYDPGESALEARIMLVINAAGLERPTQQHRLQFGPDRYRIDFAWPNRKVYLEGNGFGFHRLATDLDRDARR